MNQRTLRGWYLVHKWSSLVCTVFLLMLCITGLPLIFHEEIDRLTEGAPASGPAASGDAPELAALDAVLGTALKARPGEVPLFMAFDNEGPEMTVTTGPAPDAVADDMTTMIFDRLTGEQVGTFDDGGVMHFILRLHVDMFLDLPGMLFLGVMGLLFFVATVSGIVLYAPFMRKLDFGTVRASRSTRVKWLDYHNLLGIVAAAWIVVVGLTGVINTLATPIIRFWQMNELTEMTQAYAGRPALPPARYGSLDTAMQAARAAVPHAVPQFIAFPGGAFSSAHHYAVFLQGDTPLTQRMLTPALVDGETGALTDVRPLPWYVQTLLLSQPLHFGDYGGLPLKILWALLDIFTIIVLGSGLYLWLGKRRAPLDARVREVETGGVVVPVAAE